MRAPAVTDDCVITLSVFDVCKTFSTGQHSQGRRARWITRTCTQSMGWPTGKCLHWYFQPLPVCNTVKVTCLNDSLPVALTSVAMKCFERLVMVHINTIISETLDPLQFAYRQKRSTDDAISIALHTALSHLDKRNTYVRMLFID